MQVAVRAGLIGLLSALAGAMQAQAGPVDLSEQRARPILVSFEVSPPNAPASLDQHYSEQAPAWLEPGPGAGKLTIRVAGKDLERVLADFDPVPGSFGDYVWILDASSGHVLAASVTGAFVQRLSFGFFDTKVEAEVVARMSTLRPAGFRRPRTLLGHQLFDHCDVDGDDCRLVEPRPYDPRTGYVNAVGSISARAVGGFSTETYSPLGEAVFSEMPADTTVSAR